MNYVIVARSLYSQFACLKESKVLVIKIFPRKINASAKL